MNAGASDPSRPVLPCYHLNGRQSIHSEAIPQELRDRPQWVLWRYERSGNPTKPAKVPYQPGDRARKASSSNTSTWATFEQVLDAYTEGIGDGIGYVLSSEDPYAAIDLDSCRDPDSGKVAQWAMDLVRALQSYTEVSPSGTGVHLVARGILPKSGLNRSGIELYDRLRYVTMTGEHLPGTPWSIEPREAQIAYLAAQLDKQDVFATVEGDVTASISVRDDATILAQVEHDPRCQALWRGDLAGYPSHSEADAALCALLSQYTQDANQIERLFGLSGLVRAKWSKRSVYRRSTVQFALSLRSPARAAQPAYTPPTFADQREAWLAAYDADLEFTRDALALLGVQGHVEPLVPFVIPCSTEGARATAQYLIYVDRHGLYTCRDADPPGMRYTLTHLYAAHLAGVAPGEYEPLPRVSLAVYKLRLLLSMGRIHADPVVAPPLPHDAPIYAQQAYRAFALLLTCRRAYSGSIQPAPFSARWAARWIPTTIDKARRGITWLIENGFLVPQGKERRSTLYALRKPLE